MKDKVLSALKTKFKGGNANVLNRLAERLAKNVKSDEEVTTAVEGVTQDLLDVIESYGDSRANEAQQTAVKGYEAKYNLKDGKPTTGGGADDKGAPSNQPTPAGGADDVPAWAKALMEQNEALTKRLAQMDTERTTATRKEQLSAIYKKLPADLRKPYERIAVDTMTEEQFTAFVGEVTTEVDGIVATVGTKGSVFGRPHHNNGKPNGDTLTEAQQQAIGQRVGTPKEGEQPF